MTRFVQIVRSLTLATAFVGVLACGTARGQEAAANPNADEGGVGQGPVPGYIAAGLLACGTVFVLCKSARR